MPHRAVMTIHGPMAEPLAGQLMKPAIDLMTTFGFKTWVTHEDGNKIILMAETPQVWLERGATKDEWEYFWLLYNQGEIEKAQKFARTGIPRARSRQ